MISRRQLRIKALQTLYAYYKTEDRKIAEAEKELLRNINKSYDLYHYLFILIIEIANYADSRIDMGRNKLVPSSEDLNPNTRFIESRILEQLRNNDQLIRYAELKKLTWVDYPELIKELYLTMIKDEGYQEFMSLETVSYSDERRLLGRIFTHVIYPSESLDSVLEEQSIYWNDDIEFIMSMVLKTLKRFKENQTPETKLLLDLYKNTENLEVPEDKEFVIELFRKSIIHKEEYLEYIKSNTKNWDLDRIAFMDILIMQMAITEFICFDSIPTKVSLNEYLEISKMYSTSKSNVFINGVLDKVVAELKAVKKINKKGRGLIGELDDEPKK